MESAFRNLVDALASRQTSALPLPDDAPSGAGALQADDPVMQQALALFYYWVIFAPLSRGTAICGYIALSAVALVCGSSFKEGLPNNRQMVSGNAVMQ